MQWISTVLGTVQTLWSVLRHLIAQNGIILFTYFQFNAMIFYVIRFIGYKWTDKSNTFSALTVLVFFFTLSFIYTYIVDSLVFLCSETTSKMQVFGFKWLIVSRTMPHDEFTIALNFTTNTKIEHFTLTAKPSQTKPIYQPFIRILCTNIKCKKKKVWARARAWGKKGNCNNSLCFLLLFYLPVFFFSFFFFATILNGIHWIYIQCVCVYLFLLLQNNCFHFVVRVFICIVRFYQKAKDKRAISSCHEPPILWLQL